MQNDGKEQVHNRTGNAHWSQELILSNSRIHLDPIASALVHHLNGYVLPC